MLWKKYWVKRCINSAEYANYEHFFGLKYEVGVVVFRFITSFQEIASKYQIFTKHCSTQRRVSVLFLRQKVIRMTHFMLASLFYLLILLFVFRKLSIYSIVLLNAGIFAFLLTYHTDQQGRYTLLQKSVTTSNPCCFPYNIFFRVLANMFIFNFERFGIFLWNSKQASVYDLTFWSP